MPATITVLAFLSHAALCHFFQSDPRHLPNHCTPQTPRGNWLDYRGCCSFSHQLFFPQPEPSPLGLDPRDFIHIAPCKLASTDVSHDNYNCLADRVLLHIFEDADLRSFLKLWKSFWLQFVNDDLLPGRHMGRRVDIDWCRGVCNERPRLQGKLCSVLVVVCPVGQHLIAHQWSRLASYYNIS